MFFILSVTSGLGYAEHENRSCAKIIRVTVPYALLVFPEGKSDTSGEYSVTSRDSSCLRTHLVDENLVTWQVTTHLVC